MRGDDFLDHREVRPQDIERSLVALLHETAVVRHISSQDCGKTTFHRQIPELSERTTAGLSSMSHAIVRVPLSFEITNASRWTKKHLSEPVSDFIMPPERQRAPLLSSHSKNAEPMAIASGQFQAVPVIVIIGVFIGIQVSNWNDHRLERARLDQQLASLRTELEGNLATLGPARRRSSSHCAWPRNSASRG